MPQGCHALARLIVGWGTSLLLKFAEVQFDDVSPLSCQAEDS